MIKKICVVFSLISLIIFPVLDAVSQVTPFPVACYNFDGSLVNDDPSVGIADLGELNNLGTYESGAGICYGTDSVYVFGQGDGLSLSKNNLPTQTYSLELYFQFTSLSSSPSGRRRILRFKSENDAGLYLSPEGRLVFQSDNSQLVLDSGTTVVNEGEWMNISISRDGTVVPPEIIIYLNGNEEIRIPTDNSTELLNDFKIFEDNSGGDPFYKDENASGKIDYLRFYGEALDATQIDNLFSESQIKSDMLITATPDSTICFGETITLTASGGDGTYNWSTGETTTSIIVSPLDTTVYWVESTIQSPCDRKCFKLRDSLTVNVVQFPIVAITASTPACVNSPVTLSYVGNADILAATFDWNFAGGSAVNTIGETYDVTWNSIGTKNVTLRVTENGCFTDAFLNVQIYDIPTSTFSLPTSVCTLLPAAISYTGTGTSAATYTWDFDGGTATNVGGQNYNVAWNDLITTTKTISLTVTENGCSSTTINTITIYPIPTPTFTIPIGACVQDNLTVTYTGSADISTATFDWNFAGGSTVNTIGETYDVTWNSSGTKNVALRVTENGCSSDTLVSVQIYDIPTSTFSLPTSVCTLLPAAISYTGTGTAAATYTWDFDGGTATNIGGQNYNVVWNDLIVTTKTVSLTVTENGCSTTTSNTITINPTPTSTFSLPTGVCIQDDLAVTYTGTADPLTATFNWNFDGAVASQTGGTQNYTLNWSAGGVKTITLTVTENGCVSTQTVATVGVNNFSSFTITSNQGA
ncbi:MAG: hypothetical protein OEW67_05855, partial [Cyclobacteriaceae bacterium]|nr:hypothetical protein [Cyclobacteriaceae bacterium]